MNSLLLTAAAFAVGAHPILPPTHAVRTSPNASPAQRGSIEPSPSSWVNARQVFLWSDGAIYHVYTEPGMITDIALQPGEALIAVAAGDTARWVIGDTTSGSGEDKRTHVLVKPFSTGLSTNLVITTDKRTYHLRLSSGPTGGIAALAWNYPLDELVAVKRAEAAAEAAKPIAAGLGIEQMYFGYQITGDAPSWRPLRAFDDGRQTFIEFSATIGVDEAPPLFLIGADGAAELVNYRMRGRFYVVDRIFDVAELRLGTRKQQVVRITRGGGKGKGRS
ncbi:P-type conjugative transfer protein TrbG [Novosphingobium clariflavum]|uniref:P-type conjugative transfer protein TrbG n=1 Tax=Novosphingobium clariflavum TaxID=2029884 RepID=A0ABV6SAW3_9SPHN|nr:P-type conjugative transfer protein TrbG [Novosphingobium clariflavum]